MEKILTITVPTYNVEKYLKQCLDSFVIPEILEQIEVLIVNDGSSDSSPDIAAEYVKKYPDTFILINKENGGHGSTINTGIANARGKYFKVVDSDDWVDRKAMLHLSDTLNGCDSDLIYSNYYWVDHKTGKRTVEFEKPFFGVQYGKEYAFDSLPEDMFLKMHGFTVRTQILKKIPKIAEHCFYVDMEYVVFPIPYIKTITFIPDFVYQYRVGLPNQSVSMERMRRDAENYDRVWSRILRFYEQLPQEKIGAIKKSYLEHVLARLFASRIKIFLSAPKSKETLEQMKQFDEEIKDKYPGIYEANCNRAVSWLRKTDYKLYPFAAWAWHMKQKLH